MLSCIGMSTYLGDIKLLLHFVLYIAKNWLICLDRHMYITNQFQHSLVPERTLYSVLYIAFLVVRLRLCLRFASRLSLSSSLYSSAAPMLLTSSFLFDFTFLFVSYFFLLQAGPGLRYTVSLLFSWLYFFPIACAKVGSSILPTLGDNALHALRQCGLRLCLLFYPCCNVFWY